MGKVPAVRRPHTGAPPLGRRVPPEEEPRHVGAAAAADRGSSSASGCPSVCGRGPDPRLFHLQRSAKEPRASLCFLSAGLTEGVRTEARLSGQAQVRCQAGNTAVSSTAVPWTVGSDGNVPRPRFQGAPVGLRRAAEDCNFSSVLHRGLVAAKRPVTAYL